MKFQDYQRAFTAHIRDPGAKPRPAGVPARRMRVYNELLYNNVEGFLLACFPVCREVLGLRRWARLVRAFFRDHACRSPYFRHIPEEFLRYLAAVRSGMPGCPEFLEELAHYEWVELALDTSADAELPAHDPQGDLLDGRPLPNPVSRLLEYRWPVHRLGPRHRPAAPPAQVTRILAFRDAEFRVRFLEVSAATARLLQLLRQDGELTGRAALMAMAAAMRHPDPAALTAQGAGILADLRQQGAILGARR